MKKIITAVTATTILLMGTSAVHVSAEEYQVQNQDTLWGIANKYETSVDHLMDVNDLDSSNIYVGQSIETGETDENTEADNKVASKKSEVHNVEKGDTLYAISNLYDVTVDDIKSWNDLSSNVIYVDQELNIEGASVKSATTSKTESSDQKESKGETFSAKATAYTANCAGCTGVTATGINLNAKPNKKVIAVDPDVIPLGSKVHVEGYGEAIAGDVGGAINGNKIDVHVPSSADANKWGVRTVDVTVLD